MPQEIPLTSEFRSSRVTTTIDGVSLIFDVRWNSRAGSWYMNVLDPIDESPIVSGVRILLGASLAVTADPRLPGGIVVARDLTARGLDAGIDDLGTRVIVEHYTLAEVAAL